MCEPTGRRVGEAQVVASVTGRKHVISLFLAKARSGLGSGAGRGLMWDADPGGMEARDFLPSLAPPPLLLYGSVLGLWIFLKQTQEGVALGTAPPKARGCPVYSEHELGARWGGGYDVAQGPAIRQVVFHLPFFQPCVFAPLFMHLDL